MLRKLAIWSVVLVTALILVLTLSPAAGAGHRCALGIPCTLAHVLAFGALGTSLAALFATSSVARRSPRRALAMLVLGVWIFAAADELIQGQVGRDASIGDWAADMFGALLGLFVGSALMRVLLTRFSRGSHDVTEAGAPRPARRNARTARR